MFVEVSVRMVLVVSVEGALFVVVVFDGLQLNIMAVKATVIRTNIRFIDFVYGSEQYLEMNACNYPASYRNSIQIL
jgi:hypothetical protein